ncbi:MAG: hypothetical protein J0L70_07615 [Leptolyngbya sp. UWPOB_LEPTO1]|uniref:hypothetical protein n=1 Tax=Leptolyngbya sp. UWPOB_LEPTO1 TaxID=2815653 RepID=UPI001ACE9DBC|nr:hypothetical protein [Leptolyngbya sp. UWPOB_LEPTO1]MBN8560371.1 hypothetical protein [Leptolyngbya sp. UWPOB_LEPTO1]
MLSHQPLLILKGRAGLGNRLLCVLGGILYAQLTQRKLLVDWRDGVYSDGVDNAFYQLMSLIDVDQAESIPVSRSVYPTVWKTYLDKTVYVVSEYCAQKELPSAKELMQLPQAVNFTKLDYSEEVLVHWSFSSNINQLRRHFRDKLAQFENQTNLEVLSHILKSHIQVDSGIIADVDQFVQAKFFRRMIGVHVRYTDRKVELKPYLKSIDRLMISDPDAGIFLATDNAIVEKIFYDRYSNKIVTSEKWLPSPSSDSLGIHFNSDAPSKLQVARQAMIDICLLSRCSSLVFNSVSTFGVIALLMSTLDSSQVFDLSKYTPTGFLKHLARHQTI